MIDKVHFVIKKKSFLIVFITIKSTRIFFQFSWLLNEIYYFSANYIIFALKI